MIPMKVRKKDKELGLLAPTIRVMVDVVERLVAEELGPEFAIDHKVNLYIGDRQRFANNPRSGKMYIQYDGDLASDGDPDSEIRNLYVTGVLHEVGHSYLKIENSLKRAKESIAAEGLANLFALIVMDEACARMGKESYLVKNDYPGREKGWFSDLFASGKKLPYQLEATRFFRKRIAKDALFELIRRFGLKHKTYMQFEKILEEALGAKTLADYRALIDSFDLDEYARKYGRKA